jgi:tetratricopeptide (TPR) repeat protein
VHESDRLARAIELRESGELEQALPLLLQLREELPDDAQVAIQTAWVHDSLGLENEAVPHYEAALAAGLPDDQARGAYLGFGSTLRTLGRDADSERVFRRGHRALP